LSPPFPKGVAAQRRGDSISLSPRGEGPGERLKQKALSQPGEGQQQTNNLNEPGKPELPPSPHPGSSGNPTHPAPPGCAADPAPSDSPAPRNTRAAPAPSPATAPPAHSTP